MAELAGLRVDRVRRFLDRTFNSSLLHERDDLQVDRILGSGVPDAVGGPDNCDGSENEGLPKASLLGLPVELRQVILEFVLGSHTFLSSSQQVDFSSSAVDKVVTGHGDAGLQSPYRIGSGLSRFMHRSVLFQAYPTSRQADTAILFTCRQLYDEGIHLWYATKYYLSLIVEQGTPDLSLNVNDNDNTGGRLRFDPLDQETFWLQIARIFRFPSLQQASRFKKFHLSLFVEQNVFHVIDRRLGLQDHGLPSQKIFDILMDRTAGRKDQDVVTTTSEDWEMVLNYSKQRQKVRFLDHTYLGLACDAVDDAHPGGTTTLSHDDAALDDETKLSFSVEMWRTN